MTPEAHHRCGHPNLRCAGCDNAISKTGDEAPSCHSTDIRPSTCRNVVKVEGTRCHTHNPGAKAPQVVAKAVERKVESDLRSLLNQYDDRPVEDHLQALLSLAGEMMAWKQLLSDRVAGLREEKWRYSGRVGEEV